MRGKRNWRNSSSMGMSMWLVFVLTLFSILIILLHMSFSTISISISNSLILKSQSHLTTSSQAPLLPVPPEKPRGKIRNESKLDQLSSRPKPLVTQISCDRTPSRYDLCQISGPTVVDPFTSTFLTMGRTAPNKSTMVEKIKPYPRKFEGLIMARIKEVTLISGPPGPPCKVHHRVPALVFSAGGYTGNFYHDFNDGFIPLFITVNTILLDQDFQIVITEGPDWWTSKYADLLRMFSKHPIITLKHDTATHCFPSVHLGLITHGLMTINQTLLPNSKTYLDFHGLLHEAYSGHHNQISMPKRPNRRPCLVLVSRNGNTGRRIINQKEMIREIKRVGFDVIVFDPSAKTSLHDSYALISSSHCVIGVHGAGLTHSLFLRPGSVFVQIVPIGVEWAADVFFGRVGRGLNLEYIEYRIRVEESSLVDKYGKDSLLLKDPHALQNKGWPTKTMDIYLKEQNVKLDLVRFKGYLKEAYRKAYKFMRTHRFPPKRKQKY
ncbi:hypothetical protein L6164_020857 [Bauhinia variegata]|uniref:Uncharacterized protein n=1 Tax=Bauhinia variegata TaxID=167791 RepID=A0ACB9MWM5_BAUVA|nr:hypothetical protein L6164_020857 [Bauhinia variegata]